MKLLTRWLSGCLCLLYGLLSPWAYAESISLSINNKKAAANTNNTSTRLAVWLVSPFGQPVQELASAPLSVSFKLFLPKTAPTPRQQVPLNDRVTWPALLFEKASAPAKVAEARFFSYIDSNKSGKHEADEALKEVSLQAASGEVFVVWSSANTVVTGSKGYLAPLEKGWNVLTVDIKKDVSVSKVAEQTIELR